MDNTLFFQILSILLLLFVGVYQILALIIRNGDKVGTQRILSFFRKIGGIWKREKEEEEPIDQVSIEADTEITNDVEPDETTELSVEPSAPIVDYSSKANSISEAERKIEDFVEEENKRLTKGAPPMSYEDDTFAIALDELSSLRRAIRSMTRELMTVKRSNKEMEKMMRELHSNHGDALERLKGSSLFVEESKSWKSEFAKQFRRYEQTYLMNPEHRKSSEQQH